MQKKLTLAGKGNWIYLGLLGIGLCIYLYLSLSESLMAWERHQLFCFSGSYLSFFCNKPYPVLLYLQAFFSQFYLYPLGGAALMALLLCTGVFLSSRLCRHVLGGLLWLGCMLPTLGYFNLLWVEVWLFIFLGGLLLVSLKKKVFLYGASALVCLVLAFCMQENGVLALVFYFFLVWARLASLKTAWGVLLCSFLGGGLGVALLYWGGYPFYYAQFLFSFALLKQEIGLIYSFPLQLFICPAALQYFMQVSGLLLLGLPLLCFWKKRRAWEFLALLFVAPCLYGGWVFQREIFYKIDRLGHQNRWEEALQRASLAFYTTRFYGPSEEGWMADYIKISLLATRQATQSLFSYSGSVYFPFLFTEMVIYFPSSYFLSLYYSKAGLYAENLHLNYDFMTSQRQSRVVLENVLQTSVVVEDYAPCPKFIALFKQSLFHRDVARKYEGYLQDTAGLKVNLNIASARQKQSLRNHTVLAYLPDDNMQFRSRYELDNPYVYEYCLSLWLVHKNHPKILEEWPRIKNYYLTPPQALQEALLACFPPGSSFAWLQELDPVLVRRYAQFMQALGLYQNGYLSFKKLKKNFEKTYWFHLFFNTLKPLDNQTVYQKNTPAFYV